MSLATLVPDHAPSYHAADTVIVPIRAGGGTRIKILEAFAHGCPVVASTIGAEGIDALPEQHLLIADTPEAFADCCLRLRQDRSLRERLIANALALVRSAYTPEALQRIIDCLPEIRAHREFPTRVTRLLRVEPFNLKAGEIRFVFRFDAVLLVRTMRNPVLKKALTDYSKKSTIDISASLANSWRKNGRTRCQKKAA